LGATLGTDNVVVVYRQSDSESQTFAERYQQIHNLNSDQLVAIPCSSIEILADYATFQTEVESPISSAINSSPLSDYTIFAIVLMPRVPGGFYDGGDAVSSTSRLSRINHSYSKHINNPLYDRKDFKRFDSADAEIALICTRFDSPTGSITRQWFDNTESALTQIYAGGTFFFDPYSAIQGSAATQYESELLSFHDTTLSKLGLDVQSSFQIDPYIDPLIPQIENDSFFWGWGADRSSLTYFKESVALRAFFYNADFDGAYTMRDIDERTWPLLAIRSGYVSAAGPLSDPGISGFLRPIPFFEALFRSATLGEAMLFSVPHLNWTMDFFGDPLLTFSFNGIYDDSGKMNIDRAWQLMVNCTSQSIVSMYRKSLLMQQLFEQVVSGDDPDVAISLTRVLDRFRSSYTNESWKNDFINLTKALVNVVTIKNQTAYSRHYIDLSYYLSQTDNSVTEILLDTLQNPSVQNSISSDNIEEEGVWDLTFELEHEPGTFAFYHFELDISVTEGFEDIILSRDSFSDTNGWEYEDGNGDYSDLTSGGLVSSHAGMNVRYLSQEDENLTRGFFYYFRIRQKDQLTTFPERIFRQVVYR